MAILATPGNTTSVTQDSGLTTSCGRAYSFIRLLNLEILVDPASQPSTDPRSVAPFKLLGGASSQRRSSWVALGPHLWL